MFVTESLKKKAVLIRDAFFPIFFEIFPGLRPEKNTKPNKTNAINLEI